MYQHYSFSAMTLNVLVQLTEALACVSALYLVRSLSSAAAYAAATRSAISDTASLLSPHWLLIYLAYNAVDVPYMLFVGFIQISDRAQYYYDHEHDWSVHRERRVTGLPDGYAEKERARQERENVVYRANVFLSGGERPIQFYQGQYTQYSTIE